MGNSRDKGDAVRHPDCTGHLGALLRRGIHILQMHVNAKMATKLRKRMRKRSPPISE
jgi:hypothetical protein